MDDIASMITQFLGSEEGMAQLRAVSEALGLGDVTAAASAAPPSGQGQQVGAGFTPPAFQGSQSSQAAPQIDLNTLMMMQKAVSMMGQEDKNTELLRALKPHFSPERAKKVDDAIRIMQLIRLLPVAKELGIFDSFRRGGAG